MGQTAVVKHLTKLFDILFRFLLGSGTTWNQAKAKVHKELGISQAKIFAWKSHSIVEIDSKKNLVILKGENGKLIPIESDKKTTQNLIKGIAENQFLPKYGTDFINEIKSWNFEYYRTKPPEYKVDLRAKLKPEDQTTEKRKKMYHKRNIVVSEFFIKKLIEKTI
ncbi:hypothetical protein [Flavobacterium sp. ASW18X]|uniref:hypothetical protein n=1 Tax=Flavobacterium sp. ASW18X TaxID=2572595 RepID=UPI0010AEE82A|nr:hypothetical protein [Flavobacterium sp. ASW18X]TKD54411.1 hypothetical protein FBT53_15930 [Flavobacterium sp. ASW18X]